MAWQQPQLTEPPMGPTDEIRRLQRRLLYAYPKYSKAVEVGVTESGVFDIPTDQALRNIQQHLGLDPTRRGELTYESKKRLGVIIEPPKAREKRFVQQGVGFSTDAFLMGDPTHSYVNAVDEGSAELLRLALPLVGVRKVWIGYSMGDDVVAAALRQWPAERRDEIACVVGFGGPSKPPGPTLLGNDPGGSGISGLFTPEWARGRTYHFTQDGDMYPNAVGILPDLYQILVRLEISIEFAFFLFSKLTSVIGPALLGIAGALVPGFGALSAIAGLVTEGPESKKDGPIVGIFDLFALLPELIATIAAALKFVSTNAHYHYHDQPRPFWRDLTAVDCAAQIIAETVPDGIAYTVPGTVSWWNDGPPAWTAWKLP